MRFKIPYGGMNSKARRVDDALPSRIEIGEYNVDYTAYEQVGSLEVYDGENNKLMTIEDRGPLCRLWIKTSVEVNGNWEYPQYFLARWPLPSFLRSRAPRAMAKIAYEVTREFNRLYREKAWQTSFIGQIVEDARWEKEKARLAKEAVDKKFS